MFDDAAAAVEALFRDLRWAEAQGVELALFPECYLLGHSYQEAVIAARAKSTNGKLWRTLLARLEPVATAAIVGAFERRGVIRAAHAGSCGSSSRLGSINGEL